jgi:hypothetical protein
MELDRRDIDAIRKNYRELNADRAQLILSDHFPVDDLCDLIDLLRVQLAYGRKVPWWRRQW